MPVATTRAGLCSVTLRSHPPDEVVALARRAGLAAIEWGADVHVPPGDTALARDVARTTADAGIAVAAYGSYLRLGRGDDPGPVLASAAALGAPRVRVWAGETGSASAGPDLRAAVVRDGRAIADRAADLGLGVGLEFHGGTLTDTPESTLDLLAAVDRPALGTYWQPPQDADDDRALAGLAAVRGHVLAVHAFSWWPGDRRHPLSARRTLWERVVADLPGRPEGLDVLLEFVVDDAPAQLVEDAAELRTLLHGPA